MVAIFERVLGRNQEHVQRDVDTINGVMRSQVGTIKLHKGEAELLATFKAANGGRETPVPLQTDEYFVPISDRIVRAIAEALKAKVTKGMIFLEGNTHLMGALEPDNSRIRNANSAHEVFFCRLKNEGSQGHTFAVKPHESSEKALSELINSALVRFRGIETLKPYGVVLSGGKEVYYLSHHSVIHPLDDEALTRWGNLVEPIRKGNLQALTQGQTIGELFSSAEILSLQRIQEICKKLGVLHRNLVVHGDSQVKNFVAAPTGEPFPIDFESTRIYPNEELNFDSRDFWDKYADLAVHDLRILFNSLMASQKDFGVGVFEGMSKDELAIFWKFVGFDAYYEGFVQDDMRYVEPADAIVSIFESDIRSSKVNGQRRRRS